MLQANSGLRRLHRKFSLHPHGEEGGLDYTKALGSRQSCCMLVRKLPDHEVPGHKIIITEAQLGVVWTMLVERRKIMHAGQSTPASPV